MTKESAVCPEHSGLEARIQAVNEKTDTNADRIDKIWPRLIGIMSLCLVLVGAMFGWTAYEIRNLDNNISSVREAVAAHVGSTQEY